MWKSLVDFTITKTTKNVRGENGGFLLFNVHTKSGFNSFKLFQNKKNKTNYENVSNINIAQ